MLSGLLLVYPVAFPAGFPFGKSVESRLEISSALIIGFVRAQEFVLQTRLDAASLRIAGSTGPDRAEMRDAGSDD